MTSRPCVILTEPIAHECRAWLAERAEVIDAPAPQIELLRRAEALIVRTYTKVDGDLLASAPGLKVVGRAGVGLDNVDLAACAARSVRVVHTPDANSEAVCELVWALILDEIRPRERVREAPDDQSWRELRASLVGDRQLSRLTLGVYGLGRAGKRVARVGRAFGMETLYTDLLEIPDHERQGARPVDPDELLEKSDVVTLHVDGRPENRHLIDAEALLRLKQDVIFVNASRGFVVNEAALAERLVACPAMRACLDVLDPEPPEVGNPLLGLPNARVTPHIGAATRIAHENMSWVVRDVWRVLQGASPEHEARVAGAPAR